MGPLRKQLIGLTQGCAPIKFKVIFILEQPWYVTAVGSLFHFFLSAKQRRRLKLCGTRWTHVMDSLGGADRLPAMMGNGATGSDCDRLWGKAL